ncbi:MAG: polymer-forming cytoskeletal protein [Spirochaetaceae bacterium]|nr:polymer-forming cytoskeletal protein [Myxococcales bacterium]MCB9724456.1 polymer-forming cytoskeletal protein [Spirochaetaceae bacterium]HPG25895.1 polymer-forming cytoskeletal protein [Myxococcota bacterium]
MAISGFGRGKDENHGASGSSSGASMGGFGNLTAFIDQGSEFEGKLSFKDTVRIDGSFSGEITSDNTLIVGESGQIHATIKSVCVVISGLVEGDIHATDQILLHKTANVTGDLQAPKIVMEEGAQLNGTVRMGGSAKASGKGAPVKAVPDAQGGGGQQPAKAQNG